MNKCGLILGVAAVTALAGCLDPKYAKKNNHNEPTIAPTYVGDDDPVAPGAGHLVQVGEQPTGPVGIVTTVDDATTTPINVTVDPGVPGFDDVGPTPGAGVTAVDATHGNPTGPATTTYVVRPGDTLSKISKRYNIKLDSIRRANPGLKGDTIRLGQKLELPGTVDVGEPPAPAASATTATSSAKPFVPYTGETKEYVVQKGDVLGIIARKHGCTVRQLKELNGMKNDVVYLGKKMKVPAGKSQPAAVTSKPVALPEVPATVTKTPDAPTPPATTTVDVPTPDVADTPADAAANPSGEFTEYEVAEGDDFTNLSIYTGLSPSDIRRLNNLDENEELKPGMKIRIPAGSVQ